MSEQIIWDICFFGTISVGIVCYTVFRIMQGRR